VKDSELIVLIGPAHPLRGGIAHFNESLAKNLRERGYRVVIVSFSLQYPAFLFPGKTQKTDSVAPSGLEIHSLINSLNPLSWWRTARIIASWDPEVVLIRFWIPFMGPALGTVAGRLRKQKIPTIGLVDNALPHEKRPMDKVLSRFFFRRCSAFFTLSESVASDLKRLAPGKPVETSPHPVYDVFGERISREEALATLQLDPECRYILFFGFIRKYKGLDLLIQGFKQSGVFDENVKLLVAGEFYEDESKYRDLVSELNLSGSVIFHDRYISDDRVKYYFGVASLVAQTYRSATQSGVTQIAYHFERPMLVTDVGGLPEIVPDGVVGFVVRPEVEAIGEGIGRFFREGLETKFSSNAESEKARFSWKYFTDRFLNFIESKNLW